MKATIPAILVAAALVMASAPAMAAAEKAAANDGATSVAEMMQRMQERQLRARLVKEGRWAQVRELDEDIAKRMREKQDAQYAKVNEDLDRNGNVEGAGQGALLNECGPDELHPR